ncbi:LRR receptor-like serine/threonine-protein kinase [Tripterygium wilfordii]|uniref:LRR receptor-like serine/threonine-protein kinase n=1 Tax=Tripterygium wilfordii TaxID=458696 RepID=A0A7J7C827_TRIWF|nr:probable LRR receptor-like serine/threonine-protein kinase At1g12460 [Tripterygium wilfordii]KAF5729916.1 LRR receptor-like serine/threonine-protein kinase [Tripterygium wilfordii]
MRRHHQFCISDAFLLLFTCFLGTTRVVLPVTEKEILLQFKGNITSDPYNSLASWALTGNPCQDYRYVFCNSAGFVEKIVLWNTSLGGVLSPALSGLKNLRILSLFGNRFSGNIPQEFEGLELLWKINLSSNALSGSIPEFIGNLINIRLLDLSMNGYSGEIPSALFKHCYRTKFISFSHNSLSGSIPVSMTNCANLEGFDFSFNNLSGILPSGICDIEVLDYISLRNNQFTGSVQEEIPQCQSLEHLDLSSNLFSGLAPFGVLGLKNMTYFNVSSNGFQGDITGIGTCSESLQILDASVNHLDGEIPFSITSCKGLKLLDLGFNKLSGSIPAGIGELERLLVIRLGNNSIGGTIPAEFGGIEELRVLDLHNLKLFGQIPKDISNCRILLELDVSGNALDGDMPDTLYNMTYLEILDLHKNQLNGSIPQSLGMLSKLQLLDLSQNSLSGSIPSSLGNLTMLTHLNLSYNKLSGVIPSIPIFWTFGASAFLGNPGLCGAPLETLCSANNNGTTSASRKPKLSVSVIIAIVAAALILMGVCVVTIMNIKARRSKRENGTMVVESTPLASSSTGSSVIKGKLVLFSKNLPSKYEDWLYGTKALLDKECLIGGGSIGTVYRTIFEGGISIAVKKLETLGRIRNQDEFEQEIGRLGNIHHPNLVEFQGYYWSSTMQLILSEFVPKGNLYDNLHGLDYPGTSTGIGNTELHWSRRFHIALGTARALSYLHHDCRPAILHLNIKSTNILLDENYEPKLSDYGLANLLPILDNYGLTRVHNSVGYVAPELAQSLRLSEKCDVYSYGVILLELVTGRKPVESPTANEVVVLCEYVRQLLESGSASDCFDRNLRGFVENELIQVMKLGLICTSEVPSRRPSMAEVVQVLESIRNGSY